PYLAKSWLADFSGICSSEFLVLRSLKVCPQFLNYYTLSDGFINQVDASTYGSKMPRASWDFIGLMAVPVPVNESEKIANFLDHETARIDTLIEKQQQLIKLLKEKRQAVISHAVTKGLNPNAKMRDSGVEWLGEVPEGWQIFPSKQLFPESKKRAALSDQQLSATQDYGVISQVKFMQLAGRRVVQLNHNQELRKRVDVGDFVISMRSFQGGLERAWDEGAIRSSYVVLKPTPNVERNYYQYLLKSVRYIQALQSTANFIRDGQDMSYQNFVLIELPFPPLEEQRSIASFLRRETTHIDQLIDKATQLILLIQERRTALISSAVTGKIDVRDWQQASNG
ncbi:MAG: restriction endonuclease subunit S, partial [Nitrosomonadaceae bacterium]|nr:restriction endonuclease subunit S [Nitrosomonadaceae bacterium]